MARTKDWAEARICTARAKDRAEARRAKYG